MQNQGEKNSFSRTQISKGLKIFEVQGGGARGKKRDLTKGWFLKQVVSPCQNVGQCLS